MWEILKLISKRDGKSKTLSFGHIIVATGLKAFDPSPMENYGYGKTERRDHVI